MELAILLSLAASLCTATSSVCQRLGARRLEQCGQMRGFDAWLVFRLARQPAWLLGFACMLAGFAFQVSALHFGPLALVQPILAVELLFVFGYLALRAGGTRPGALAGVGRRGRDVRGHQRVSPRGRADRRAASTPRPALWWLAGAGTAVAAAIAVAVARGGGAVASRRLPGHRDRHHLGLPRGRHQGAELAHSGGPAAIFTNWSVYVLMGVGAAAMLLTSHAIAAGPLAASQPGFTIGDPVTAILLGAFVFNERLATSPAALAAEVAGLVVLALGVRTLSRSALITETTGPRA